MYVHVNGRASFIQIEQHQKFAKCVQIQSDASPLRGERNLSILILPFQVIRIIYSNAKRPVIILSNSTSGDSTISNYQSFRLLPLALSPNLPNVSYALKIDLRVFSQIPNL
uniref:Uncharacterized protein n=1 Tax=Timspurckia oligopyrenoides TaxID=708627 RepID=A0A7S0ZB48_9RHOD